MRRNLTFIIAFFITILLARDIVGAPAADLILINGKIITVDAKDSIAQAIAISNGKILAVGTDDEIRKLASKDTKIIDLKGRTATPGLIDTHCHFDGTSFLYTLNLSAVKNIPEVVELVRKKVSQLQPGAWVVGEGWDEGKLAESRYITAADLDPVSPENPVWLWHTTGHYGVANTKAMQMASITAETKNPSGGIIERDANGRPTGVLKEEPAMDPVIHLIPPLTHDQQRAGLLKMMEVFNQEGMTAAKDPGIGPDRFELYRELLTQHQSTVRVCALFMAGTTLDSAKTVLSVLQKLPRPPQSIDNGMLLAGGVKIFMDGSGGARTAWVYKPWHQKSIEIDKDNTGYPAVDPSVYQQMVKMFHDAGIHVGTHAVGDRAIDWVMDTYNMVLQQKPVKGLRHSIIHDNIPTDRAIALTAKLQKEYDAGYPEAQAPFLWWIGDLYAGTFGPQRGLRLMPFKTYIEKGILWAGGSDYPVTPFPARYGLWSTIERKTLKGLYGSKPFGAEQSVDIRTALKSYTIWAARQMFLENQIGSLEIGKDADIAVWDRDLYTIPTADLQNLKCELTMLRGREVYRSPDL